MQWDGVVNFTAIEYSDSKSKERAYSNSVQGYFRSTNNNTLDLVCYTGCDMI